MNKNSIFVGTKITEELNNQFTSLAATHHVSKSVLMRIAIEMYVEDMQGVKPVIGTNHD